MNANSDSDMTGACRILHLVASPRQASESKAVAKTYLDALQRTNPRAVVEELDLWTLDLPSIDGPTLSAKYAILAGKAHQSPEAEAWRRVETLTRQFLSFDRYVISTPMWNLGVPYRLKHYIDVITQPGLTFSWTAERGYEGLVLDRPAVVAYTSAFDYAGASPLSSWDQQKTFMETWLRFIGIQDVEAITCGPTRPGEAGTAAAQSAAEMRAKRLGEQHGISA
jgi:FMN-dependent NADH-azoreductase